MTSRSQWLPARSTERAQRFEAVAHRTDEILRLLPRREMTAFVEPLVIDQFGICLLCPSPRSCIDLARLAYGTFAEQLRQMRPSGRSLALPDPLRRVGGRRNTLLNLIVAS